MRIIIDDLRGPEIYALLEEHLRGMRAHSPAASVHALDIEALRKPEITFFSAWNHVGGDGDVLLACGAINQIDASHGEIKSMRTSALHLRKGAAAAILTRIIEVATSRGYATLSLETGSSAAFAPALLMYERFGFSRCGPFAGYVEDPFSVFMRLDLTKYWLPANN